MGKTWEKKLNAFSDLGTVDRRKSLKEDAEKAASEEYKESLDDAEGEKSAEREPAETVEQERLEAHAEQINTPIKFPETLEQFLELAERGSQDHIERLASRFSEEFNEYHTLHNRVKKYAEVDTSKKRALTRTGMDLYDQYFQTRIQGVVDFLSGIAKHRTYDETVLYARYREMEVMEGEIQKCINILRTFQTQWEGEKHVPVDERSVIANRNNEVSKEKPMNERVITKEEDPVSSGKIETDHVVVVQEPPQEEIVPKNPQPVSPEASESREEIEQDSPVQNTVKDGVPEWARNFEPEGYTPVVYDKQPIKKEDTIAFANAINEKLGYGSAKPKELGKIPPKQPIELDDAAKFAQSINEKLGYASKKENPSATESARSKEERVAGDLGGEKQPEPPEELTYRSTKEKWHEARSVYESKERAYQDSLRTHLNEQAKSWNPLKSIPYAARKLFGFNQKLTPELQAMKDEATTAAIVYRDSSSALGKSKYDSILLKRVMSERGGKGYLSEESEMYARKVLARHERLVGQRIFMRRAEEQIDIMREAPVTFVGAVIERPEIKKAAEFLRKYKWQRIGAIAGIAALGAATGGIGAALMAGGIVGGRAVLGMKVGGATAAGVKTLGTLLEKHLARNAKNEAEYNRTDTFSADYEDILAKTEQDLENILIAKKTTNVTAVAAGLATGVMAAGFEGGKQVGPSEGISTSQEIPLNNTVQQGGVAGKPIDFHEGSFVSPETSSYMVQQGDNMWNILKERFGGTESAEFKSAWQNLSKMSPDELRALGIPSGSADMVHPGETVDLQDIMSAEPHVEKVIAPSSPESVSLDKTAGEEISEAVKPIGEMPLHPDVAKTVTDIETFTAKKSGFLGLFGTTETMSTNGEVFNTMKNMTLEDVSRTYQDSEYRAQVFPSGVNETAFARWGEWLQSPERFAEMPMPKERLIDFVNRIHNVHEL